MISIITFLYKIANNFKVFVSRYNKLQFKNT